MKIFILFISIFLFSCGVKEVDYSEVYINNGIYFLESNNKVFTGYITEKYPDGYSAKFYVKRGKKEGKYIYSDSNYEGVNLYKNGELNGVSKTFKLGKLINEREFKNGLLNGNDIEYYTDGSIKSKSTYKDDKLIGDTIKYYENGNIKSKYTHIDDSMNGEYLEYYENGNIQTKAYVKNNQLDGEIKIYSIGGSLLKEATLKENVIKNYKEYYGNGDLKITFINASNTRKYREYYEGNRIKLEKDYRINQDNISSFTQMKYSVGESEDSYSYYSLKYTTKNNGIDYSTDYEIKLLDSAKLLLESLFESEFSSEEFSYQKEYEIIYNKDGEIAVERSYFVTTDKIYFPNHRESLLGKIKREIIYKDNKKVKLKERTLYYDGDIVKDCTYREVDIINNKLEGNVEEKGDYITKTYKYINGLRQGNAELVFGQDAVLKYKYKDDKRNGPAVIYYSDGSREEFNYKNGVIEGKAKFYEKFSRVKEEYTYINGKKEGKSVYYLSSGDKIIKNYKNDEVDGKWIMYSYSGKKKIEANYKNGELDGEYLEYPSYSGGRKIKVYEYINGVKYYISERDK